MEIDERALKRLTFRERTIVKLRNGMDGDGYRYTRPEIARILNTTVGRVRALEKKALLKLEKESDEH